MRTTIRMALLSLLIAAPAIAQERPGNQEEKVPPQINERFQGTIAFKTAERAVRARVTMNQWHIANDESVNVPHEGLLIVHVRAGALTTVIGGRETKVKEDTFFSVPPGTPFSIRTERDSVVLHIVEFAPR